MKFFYVNVLKISFLKFTFMDIYFSIKGVPSLNKRDPGISKYFGRQICLSKFH